MNPTTPLDPLVMGIIGATSISLRRPELHFFSEKKSKTLPRKGTSWGLCREISDNEEIVTISF
jgi:hypothetical protein